MKLMHNAAANMSGAARDLRLYSSGRFDALAPAEAGCDTQTLQFLLTRARSSIGGVQPRDSAKPGLQECWMTIVEGRTAKRRQPAADRRAKGQDGDSVCDVRLVRLAMK